MTNQQDQHLSIQLRPSEVNLVLGALAELPFKLVAGLCVNIKDQADRQLNPGPKLVEDAAP